SHGGETHRAQQEFAAVLEKHGDKYHPFRFGILMSTYVGETDQQAREECEEGVWYFLKNCLKGHLRRQGRQLTYGPGVPYIPAATSNHRRRHFIERARHRCQRTQSLASGTRQRRPSALSPWFRRRSFGKRKLATVS